MSRFARAEVWTDWECAGGTRVAFVPDPIAIRTVRSVLSEERCELEVRPDSPAVADLLDSRVLRIERRNPDGTAATPDEWRIKLLEDGSGDGADRYRFTGYAPLMDLGGAEITQVLSTGETSHVFTASSLSAAELIDLYVLPAMVDVGATYWARGTVDPTQPLSLSWEWSSPLELLRQIRDLTHMELRARRNGSTGYYIDLVTQIGAGAAAAMIRPKKNLLQHVRTRRSEELVTRCSPRGGRLPGLTEYHGLARIVLVVSAVASSGTLLTLADPAGLISPIGFDDQFNGWLVFRDKTGGTHEITDTDHGAQQVTLAAATSFAVGELVQLRRSDAQAEDVAMRYISPATGSALLPYFSATTGDPKTLTIADAAAAVDMVTFDGQHDDLWATFCPQILSAASVDGNAANQRFEFIVSIAALLIGDLIVYSSVGNATPNYGTTLASIIWEVVSLDVGNKYAYVVPHYANRSGDLLPNSSSQHVWVFRPGLSFRVVSSAAGANTISFAAAPTGTNVGDLVLIAQRSAGVFPDYVDHPVTIQPPPAGFGVVARALDRPDMRGEGNEIPNPQGGTWSNPANPPDGWTATGTTPEYSQNTDPAFVKYGAARSWYVTLAKVPAPAKDTIVKSPKFYLHRGGWSNFGRAAVTVSFYLSEFSGDATITFRVLTADGLGGTNDVLTLYSTDTTASPSDPDTLKAAGGWYDLIIPAIDFTSFGFGTETRNHNGFQLQISAGGGVAGIVRMYLDAVGCYQVSYDPGSAAYVDGSFANQLLNEANLQLAARALPATEFALGVADLERIPGSSWPEDAFILGALQDFRDPPLVPASQSLRLVEMVVEELEPINTQLTLSTAQTPLTTILSED